MKLGSVFLILTKCLQPRSKQLLEVNFLHVFLYLVAVSRMGKIWSILQVSAY